MTLNYDSDDTEACSSNCKKSESTAERSHRHKDANASRKVLKRISTNMTKTIERTNSPKRKKRKLEERADPIEMPEWIPSDVFKFSYFQRIPMARYSKPDYINRIVKCRQCRTKFPAQTHDAIERHLSSKSHHNGLAGIPKWIPTGTFKVSFNGTYDYKGRSRPLPIADCRICGKKFEATESSTIQRHLERKKHKDAVIRKILEKKKPPSWIPTEIFDVFFEGKVKYNDDDVCGPEIIYPRQMARCRICDVKMPACSRTKILHHLVSQKHTDAVGEVTKKPVLRIRTEKPTREKTRPPSTSTEKPAPEKTRPSIRTEKSAREKTPLRIRTEKPAPEKIPLRIRTEKPAREKTPPSIRTDQPSPEKTPPSIRTEQPSPEKTRPSIRTDQPSPEKTRPSIRTDQPSPEKTRPSIRTDQPSPEKTRPSIRTEKPAREKTPLRIRTEKPAPSTSTEKSAREKTPLLIRTEQPSPEKTPPSVRTEKPTREKTPLRIRTEKPAPEKTRPSIRTEKPAREKTPLRIRTEKPAPSTSTEKSAREKTPLLIRTEQPSPEKTRPSTSTEKPPTEKTPQSIRTEKPAPEKTRPSIRTEKPAREKTPPSIRTEQPSPEKTRPSIRTEKPAREKTPLRIRTEKPAPSTSTEKSAREKTPLLIRTEQPSPEKTPPSVRTEKPTREKTPLRIRTEKPAPEKTRPSIRTEKPAREKTPLRIRTEKPAPSTSTEKSAREKTPLLIRTEQPSPEKTRPSTSTEKPPTEKTPPSIRTEKPAPEKTRPSIRTEKAAREKTPPSIRTEQPSPEKTRPSIRTEQPAREKTPPSVRTEKPTREKTPLRIRTEQPAPEKTPQSIRTEKPTRDKTPLWIPSEIFDVFFSGTYVSNGRSRPVPIADCRICGTMFKAREPSTIERHLERKKHMDAVIRKKKKTPSWIPTEIFDVFFEEKMIYNNDLFGPNITYPCRMARCRMCDVKMPACSRKKIRRHLMSQKHKDAVGEVTKIRTEKPAPEKTRPSTSTQKPAPSNRTEKPACEKTPPSIRTEKPPPEKTPQRIRTEQPAREKTPPSTSTEKPAPEKTPLWISTEIFDVFFEGTYVSKGRSYPRRMARCRICDEKISAIKSTNILRHLKSQKHRDAVNGEVTQKPEIPLWIPTEIFDVFFEGTYVSKGRSYPRRMAHCRLCDERISARERASILRHLKSQKHRDAVSGEVTEKPETPLWIPTEIFDVFFEGTYVAHGYVYPRRMARCRICDERIPALGRATILHHLKSQKHRDAVSGEIADKLETPLWISTEIFDVFFEGTYVSKGRSYPRRMAHCRLCDKKILATKRGYVLDHLKSQKHRDAVNGEVTEKPEIPLWIPTEIFDVFSDGTRVSKGRSYPRRMARCRLCDEKILAVGRATILRHLKSQKHRNAVKAENADKLEIPLWIPTEIFDVFYDGTFVSNGYFCPRRMARCRVCDEKIPAHERADILHHLKSEQHQGAVSGAIAEQLEIPLWIPTEIFDVSFDGTFDSNGYLYPNRMARCRICDEKIPAAGSATVLNHLMSQKHYEADENSKTTEKPLDQHIMTSPLFMMLKEKRSGKVYKWTHPTLNDESRTSCFRSLVVSAPRLTEYTPTAVTATVEEISDANILQKWKAMKKTFLSNYRRQKFSLPKRPADDDVIVID